MTAKLETLPDGGRRLVRYQRRSTQLSEDQWQSLAAIARELRLKSLGGANAGGPSWRTMLRMIADGELVVKWQPGSKVMI